jgi:hypothetical protein
VPPRIEVDADLGFSLEIPGGRTVSGQVTGSGRALTLTVSDPFAFAGRQDSPAIRLAAEVLAHQGLSVTVVAPSGPVVTLGAHRPPRWQRWVTGSRHIRIERGAGLLSLARGRARATAGALPSSRLLPPGTVWPLAPTLMRRRRRVTTTHDPERGGNPRLVVAPGPHPRPGDVRQVFALRGEVTTIGSDPQCDIRLPGLEPRHAEVRHDQRDEFVLVRVGPGGRTAVNGRPVDTALLRTASRVELGEVTLSFFREEYADHGRPYGGRLGGEFGQNRPQPPRSGRSHPAIGRDTHPDGGRS